PSNPSRIWVTLSQLGGGRVYRSDDSGVTWTDRTAGLPGIPMNSVVVAPANYKGVWVSADVGVYETVTLGATWTNFSAGLPNAMAADLLFHKQDRMLVCGTGNRGAWVIKGTERCRGGATEGTMDLIERLFGMSPDGGSGATELAILLGVTLLVAFLSWRRW